MDLAAFFAETAEAVQPKQTEKFPGFPVSCDDRGNGQDIDNNDNSRVSRISRGQDRAEGSGNMETAQAGAQAGAGGRARGYVETARETREQREQPAGSDTCISRPLFLKREIGRETGNSVALRATSGADLKPSFDERAAFLEYECGLSRAEAEAIAQAEEAQVEVPSPPRLAARASTPLPANDGLVLWHAGLSRLTPDQPPCPGYRSEEWSRARSRALDFLDRFGLQAEALGWTASRLFGVHPVAGIVRVDACGALVLAIGGDVRAVTATEISFGHLTHRTKPGQPQGVPWWEWGQ